MNTVLNSLLKEYEYKRIKAFSDLKDRKTALYSQEPRLEEIEKELNSSSILLAKNVLLSSSSNADCSKHISDLKKERSEILSKLGKTESYFSPFFSCNICNDTGYVFNNNFKQMCNCLKQKLFDSKLNLNKSSSFSDDTFNNFDLDYFSNIVDEKKYGSSISPRENMNDIKNAALDFVKNFDNATAKNLIFSGATGLGKTFLSNCISNSLLNRRKTVIYQTAPLMLDTLIADLFAKPENRTNFSNLLLTADLLIIDDLGTETINSLKFTELYTIINTRLLNLNKITKTIISTNLDLQNLFNTYDERLVSRFIGYYDIYRFYGDDIRLIKTRN